MVTPARTARASGLPLPRYALSAALRATAASTPSTSRPATAKAGAARVASPFVCRNPETKAARTTEPTSIRRSEILLLTGNPGHTLAVRGRASLLGELLPPGWDPALTPR